MTGVSCVQSFAVWYVVKYCFCKEIISMAPIERNLDTATLLKLLDEMGRPFTAKLDRIEEKLANHATKSDMDKLRQEVSDQLNRVDAKLTTGYVTKDVYESRHGQLVGRDLQLDEAIR